MSNDLRRCSERVYDGSRIDFRGHMCTRPVKVEVNGKWFCSIHSPEAKAKRRLEDERRWQEKEKAWEREALVKRLGHECIAHGITSVEQLKEALK